VDDYLLLALPPTLRDAMTRRRWPRLLVDGRVSMVFASADLPVRLHDISSHGFSIWTAGPAVRGEVRLFRICGPGQPEHLLYAVTAHVGPARPDNERGYFSGWYVESESSQNVLQDIIDDLSRSPVQPAASGL
jgi:hypothetical protein